MKRRRWLIGFVLPFLLLTSGGVWLWWAKRQYALDRQLIEALVKEDTKHALSLVHEGADPNTRYNPPPAPSLSQWMLLMLRRSSFHDASPTAFAIVCGAQYWNEDTEDYEITRSRVLRSDDEYVARMMVRHGANVDAKDDYGMTPLLWAAHRNHPKTVLALLDYGADVNARNKDGYTSLMWATRHEAQA